MAEIATWLGGFIMVSGGILLTIALLALLGWLACQAWRSFSNMFRAVCRAEGLIHEYRRNREEFLIWKSEKERAYEDG